MTYRLLPLTRLRYYIFTTFDVMADLTFGEPLHMLEGSEYVFPLFVST